MTSPTRASQPTSPSLRVKALLAHLPGPLRHLLADRLVRNIGWYGLAEFANRFTRLITTVVLARWLIPHDFGIAAIAITTFEIVRVLAQYGIGQAVIRAPAEQLASLCATAYRASWIVCVAALLIQIGVGVIVVQATGHSEAFWMIAALSLVYLTLPFGQIQAHLIVRANRLHVLAGIAVVQVALDNLLTAAFAIGGFGAWAVVLPKLITAPIWVIGMRRAQAWRRDPAAGFAPMADLMTFAIPVIGSELLVAARFNLDKVLVGALLGVEALGTYYFVFNAGLGFALSVTSSLSASVYPDLAEVAGNRAALMARFDSLLVRAALPCAAIIALQAALSIVYVPLVFGQRWNDVAYLVAVLCASAIVKPVFDSASQLLRASGHPRIELAASAILTTTSLLALAIALPYGLAAGVLVLSGTAIVVQLTSAAMVRHYLRRQQTVAQQVSLNRSLLQTETWPGGVNL